MKLKYIKALLAVLMALTVAFIFSQSILPPEKSSEASGTVGDIVAEIIPPETEVGGFIQINLRKLAHFTEFFLLGIECSLFVFFFVKRPLYMVLSFPAAAIVALVDETIQIFSGRGPSIIDVWIDIFGFFTASVLVYTVCFISALIYKKCKQKL